MLDDIRESEETSLTTDNAPEMLRDIGIIAALDVGPESVHGLEEMVVILFIRDMLKMALAALAES